MQAKLAESKNKAQELTDKRIKIDDKMSEIDRRIKKMTSESAIAGRAVASAEAQLMSAEKEQSRIEAEVNPYIELVESNKKGMAEEEASL